MSFFKALKKIFNRKKRKGYYESSDLLTMEEKQSLLIVSLSLTIPVIIAFVVLMIN